MGGGFVLAAVDREMEDGLDRFEEVAITSGGIGGRRGGELGRETGKHWLGEEGTAGGDS